MWWTNWAAAQHVDHVKNILRDGTSADRQLKVYRETGDLKAVVQHLVVARNPTGGADGEFAGWAGGQAGSN